MKQLSIEDFGAKTDGKDVRQAIEKGLDHLMQQSTGGTLWIPEGRYALKSTLHPPRGSNAKSIALRGFGKRSILDMRNSSDVVGIQYDGTGTDGPTHMEFHDFRLRGNNTKTAMKLDFQSGSHMTGMMFDNFRSALNLSETYAFTLANCSFLSVTHNVVKFRTNAHNFRMMCCNGTNLAQAGGAIVNFANTDEKETHSVLLMGNDLENIGTIIRCSAKSGGLTGLTGIGNYTEGFEPGKPFFLFPAAGVRGFLWQGGSFSKGRQTAPPEVQVIKNVDGGLIDGIRLNRIELKMGGSCKKLKLGKIHSVGTQHPSG